MVKNDTVELIKVARYFGWIALFVGFYGWAVYQGVEYVMARRVIMLIIILLNIILSIVYRREMRRRETNKG